MAMVAFIFIIFGFTVPKMMGVFLEIGVELPPLTKMILAFSKFITGNLVLLLILTALTPVAMVWGFRSKLFRPMIDYVMAKAAVIGPITRDICIARFATNLGALYESEIPIVQGLAICSKIAGNALYNRGLVLVRKAVEEGRAISDGMKESKVFPSMVVLTVRVGEENGKLDESLRKIAAYHSRKAKERVERALKLFEPIMLIVLVVMVGFLAYALLSPMMSMIEQLSNGPGKK
jgi:type IV pilus assembly protein PilC